MTHLNDMEYQVVQLRGEFIHDKEMFVGPRSLIEPENNKQKRGGVFSGAPKSGYLVVTPFKLDGREYANFTWCFIPL